MYASKCAGTVLPQELMNIKAAKVCVTAVPSKSLFGKQMLIYVDV